MKKFLSVLILLAVLPFTLSGCTSSPTGTTSAESTIAGSSAGETTAGADHIVSIMDFAFDPASLTIKIGESVKWENKDTAAHTVVFTDFKSDTLKTGDEFTHVFDTAGTFSYKCGVHPTMTGEIIVK